MGTITISLDMFIDVLLGCFDGFDSHLDAYKAQMIECVVHEFETCGKVLNGSYGYEIVIDDLGDLIDGILRSNLGFKTILTILNIEYNLMLCVVLKAICKRIMGEG